MSTDTGKLKEMIFDYYELGVKEGAEGRVYDHEGRAQEQWSKIQETIDSITLIPQHVLKAIERNCTPVATDGVVLVRMEDWNTIIEWVNETRLQE